MVGVKALIHTSAFEFEFIPEPFQKDFQEDFFEKYEESSWEEEVPSVAILTYELFDPYGMYGVSHMETGGENDYVLIEEAERLSTEEYSDFYYSVADKYYEFMFFEIKRYLSHHHICHWIHPAETKSVDLKIPSIAEVW